MQFTLITSCSSTRTLEPIARVGKIPPGQTMQTALQNWLQQLDVDPDRQTTPAELYRGMGFMVIAKIQEQFKPNDIRIVTGGQGLITLTEQITPYDFTAAKNEPENIYQAVTAEPFVQSVWWRMINTARNKPANPISTLVQQSSDTDLFLVSMGKVFIRYVAEDILSIPYEHRHRVRILLAASSVGSVPAQLRPFIIPFDRDAISHLPGNRNDTNHRAALQYLTLCDSEDGFAQLPVDEQRRYFLAEHINHSQALKVDLQALFKDRPYLLNLDQDSAYRVVRKEFGTFGGKMYFRSEWRKAKGTTLEPIDASIVDGAAQALTGMAFLQNTNNQTSTSEEDEALQDVKIFVEAVKKVAPNSVFTAADISNWARTYFKDNCKQILLQPNKLAYVLKSNYQILGLSETDIAGAKSYIIAHHFDS